MATIDKLPPEIESGNKEYKLKVIPDDNRIEQLASQMKWRIDEGNGIAYYYLGVGDDGTIKGINKLDYNASMKNISKVVKIINAKIDNIDYKKKNDSNWSIITIKYKNNIYYNGRIIFIGPTSSGKTTLISNIVNSTIDDGNGKSRKLVFNHKHEIYSGRTSSISIEKKNFEQNEKQVCINFIDTPGYNKYLKTTISALCKYDIQIIILCIDPLDTNLSDLKFYIRILRFFEYPFFIIFTKKDKYKSHHKICIIKNILEITGKQYTKDNIKHIPYIEVSNITKVGYRKLIKYIKEIKVVENNMDNCKFQICDIIKIPNIGKIYTGILLNGTLKKNNKYLLVNSDTEHEVYITSIYFSDKPYDIINHNQLITLQLNYDDDFCNKTDKLIVDKSTKKYNKLKVKCNKLILVNSAICIYNNQYCVVEINKKDDNYELIRPEGFINISDKIILKINDEFYFTNLI